MKISFFSKSINSCKNFRNDWDMTHLSIKILIFKLFDRLVFKDSLVAIIFLLYYKAKSTLRFAQ
jgi:hypothetical protein